MLKLRLQRNGRKKRPTYRLVVIEHSARRDGKPVEYVGYYNPLTKESKFESQKIKQWLQYGAKPSPTVFSLLSKAKIITT
jgi:small subunit ribosomal protein S16